MRRGSRARLRSVQFVKTTAARDLATGMARMQPDPSGPGRREPIFSDGGGSWCS